VSKQELLHAVVREAYDVFGHEVERVGVGAKKDEVELLIEKQEREIRELRQSLSILEGVVHERKTERWKECHPVTPSTNVQNERVEKYEDHFYSEYGQQSHQAGTPLKSLVTRSVGVKVGEVNVDTPIGSDEELSKDDNCAEEPILP